MEKLLKFAASFYGVLVILLIYGIVLLIITRKDSNLRAKLLGIFVPIAVLTLVATSIGDIYIEKTANNQNILLMEQTYEFTVTRSNGFGTKNYYTNEYEINNGFIEFIDQNNQKNYFSGNIRIINNREKGEIE